MHLTDEQKDKQILEKTISIQVQIVDEMMSDGVPTSEEDRAFLMVALSGIQRTVLSKAKIKVSESSVEQQRHQINMVAEMLKRTQSTPIHVRSSRPALDITHVPINILVGETEIGTVTLEVSDFIKDN